VERTGRAVTIYAQHEVIKDLIAARLAASGTILFEAEALAISGYETNQPKIRFRHGGKEDVLEAGFIAGCDGFPGVARTRLPSDRLRIYVRDYPFGWLGILAEAPPGSDELIYANNERGFALLTMRSPTISRLYLQVGHDEDIKNWSDERIWSELH